MRAAIMAAAVLLAGCGGGEEGVVEGGRSIQVSVELLSVKDDVDVTSDVRVKPGTYRVSDAKGDGVLRIRKSGVTLDLTGVTLVGSPDGAAPDTFEGIAVRAEGVTGVKIVGGTFRGYRGGVYLKDCAGVTIEGADVSDNRAQRLKSTPTRCDDGADWLAPHFNDDNRWWTLYGAGIYVDHGRDVTIAACRGRRTQNGIVLRNSEGCAVFDCDMSWMSGWGIALWRSSGNEISHNRFDYAVRGYSFGRYDRGQDSAGILLFEQCSDNVIAYNSATHGGDGIFMYAGHETTQRTGEGGCNRNLLYRNDFSHAVANAIECTFSVGNRFVENRLDDSNYGIWAGYSIDTLIAGNTCRDARIAGVAIEHGSNTTIEGNTFERCRTGVELWWDEDPGLVEGIYGERRTCRSEDYELSLNRFRECPLALRVDRTARVSVSASDFDACGRLADLAGACPEFSFEFNVVHGASPGWFRNDTGAKIAIGPCRWEKGQPADTEDMTFAAGPEGMRLDFGAVAYQQPQLVLRGTMDAMLPKDARRGMKTIVVDEWGPCDPTVPRLFPARQTAWGEAEFFVFGPEGTWEVASCEGADVRGDRKVPGTVFVTPPPRPHDVEAKAHPFRFEIKTSSGATLSASGVLLVASWEVRLWTWTPAAGEHGGYEKALGEKDWAKLMQHRPAVRATIDRLHNPWEGQSIAPDYFVTVASTTMHLPAGRWRFATMSDDGVRVLVDGKKVIDNWTWHAPTEDSATVLLTTGPHEIVVEHFEIDGAEALDLAIEPAE
ncbi:MAG: right-handed parallel beta-helix repeat-containing protein [Planctomycetia bacterium]|nr:right-handed parallel beta-helix repeat-containing protein [Planctomycetia bacterium]